MRKLKLAMLLITVLFAHAQRFEEVNYIGACNNEDWTKGWTDFTPIAEEYPESDIPLQGIISRNTTLSAIHTYKLIGKVYVTNNATLYIEPGTMIRAEYKSALVITKGAKIRALGTRSKPIIMTSNQPVNQRNKGDWSGLVILGNARVNTASGTGVAEGDLDPAYAVYGGKDDEDNSGVLNFVRVEFGGRRINKDHEFNGITFYGVGRNTVVDYLMSSYAGDDGIQFFGGTVNCKHLVSFQSGDDCFEYTEGYRGRQQFGISLRHFNLGDISGSRSIETESSMAGILEMGLPTTPVLSNFTLISPEIFYNQTTTANIKDAINIELGSGMSVFNTLVVGFPIGISVLGEESQQLVQDGTVKFQHNMFIGCTKPAIAEPKSFDINSWFVNPEFSNVFRAKNEADKIFVTPFSIFRPDFSTNYNSFLVKPDFSIANKNFQKSDSPLETVNYRGAFSDNDWTVGWSHFAPDVVRPAATVTIEGTISSSTAWTQDRIYLLKGDVILKNGVTLQIEPGTTILCDAVTHASLIVEPLAELIAEGDVNNPIVFTSSNEKGKRKPGDWKGITVLGNSRIAPETIKNAKGISESLPGIAIAEGGFEGNVSMKYLRIEYAGFSLDKTKDRAALHLIAREKSKTEIQFAQFTFSASDGIMISGGNADLNHLVAFNNTDDDVVTASGFTGTIQYAFMWREPVLAALNGACAIEALGCSHTSCYPENTPVLSNFTIIGPNRKEALQYNQNYRSAVLLTNGGTLQFCNSMVASYPSALEVTGQESNFYTQSGITQVRNNIFCNVKTISKTDDKDPSSIQKALNAQGVGKSVIANYVDLKLKSSMILNAVEFLPDSGSPCLQSEYYSRANSEW